MAVLVVEDGNGLADANSYASVEDFKDFADLRVGVQVPADDKVIERSLATATAWIDSNFANAFKGAQVFATQALEFPRNGFIDGEGFERPMGWMPPQLKKAVCILAVECNKGDPLYKNADGAARVVIEDSVGPLITKYAAQAPNAITQEREFPEVVATLRPLMRGFGTLRVDR